VALSPANFTSRAYSLACEGQSGKNLKETFHEVYKFQLERCVDFILRDTTEPDLDQCLALTTDRFLYDRRQVTALREMWSEFIRCGTGLTGVIADPHRPSQIMYFFTAAFVPDQRAERYRALGAPKIGYGMAEEFKGGRRPFLTIDEIADSNAGNGLNAVVTHHGYILRNKVDDERLRAATYGLLAGYLTGWNLRTYTAEVFAINRLRDGRKMGESLGHHVRSYPDDALRNAGIPIEEAPILWTSTVKDALAKPVGAWLALLFLSFSPPKFGFSLEEQRMLNFALKGLTDEAIGELIGVPATTIKMRFRRIYDKVRSAAEDSGVSAVLGSSHGQTRGAEARRHLLNYLRDHREELRPYALKRKVLKG
jgi:hypothetical protein